MEIQEYRGIRGLVAAEVIKDTSEAIEFGKVFPVIGIAELSRTTSTSSEVHFYDNVPATVIESTGKDEVTVKGSAIPFNTLATITGQEYDEELGMFTEGERANKYFALGYITKRTDGTEIFVWRQKGTFSIPDSSHKTEDEGTEANGQEIKYTGINTTYKFEKTKKTAKAINIDTGVNPLSEEEFFAKVQTPDTVNKAVVSA